MESRVIILSQDEKVEDIIDKAYDVIVKSEMLSRTNGYETLEFKIPFNYSKRDLLFNERKVEVDNRRYTIKVIDDSKSRENITTITCDATWYDLTDGELTNHVSPVAFTARAAIEAQLIGTDWTCGVCEIETTHQFTINEKNTRLYNLRYIHKIFGGDMWFDTKNKTVNLYTEMGKRTENIFKYERNVSDIKRTIDTRNLITRFTMTGKDGVTISDINDGKPYVENYDYYDQAGIPRVLKSHEAKDERFTNTAYMKWYMEQWLAQYAFPVVTYQITPTTVRNKVEMGDYIYVIDTQLKLSKWLRILAIEANKSEPWKTKYTLENVYSTISDVDDSSSTSSGGTQSAVDSQLAGLSPFNLLLNSRADDGLAYWKSLGFEVDDYNSKSGYSSFKTIGGLPSEKRLSQTVYPSTNDNYTVSAQVKLPEGYVYTDGDKVGIQVDIEYEDGTIQTEFVSLFGNFEEPAEVNEE